MQNALAAQSVANTKQCDIEIAYALLSVFRTSVNI